MKKTLTVIFLASLTLLFIGCGRQPEPVAMNYYTPSGDKELVSGIQVEITPAMVEMMKNRKVKTAK